MSCHHTRCHQFLPASIQRDQVVFADSLRLGLSFDVRLARYCARCAPLKGQVDWFIPRYPFSRRTQSLARVMLRSAASSLRAQLPRASRSLAPSRTVAARSLAAQSTRTPRVAFQRRSFAASALRSDEEGKPQPVQPLAAKFPLSDEDRTRLTRLRNVGISAHIDSGASEPLMRLFECLELTFGNSRWPVLRRQDDPDGAYPVLHRSRRLYPRGSRSGRCWRQDGLDGVGA